MSLSFRRRPVRRALADRRGIIQITATAVLWGTGGVVVRLLHDRSALDASSIAFYRLAVAAAILLLSGVGRVRQLWTALRSAPRRLVTIGIGLALYQWLYFAAVTDVGVSVATMISIGLAPLIISMTEAIRRRRLPSPIVAMTVMGATAGLALVSLGAAHDHGANPRPLVGR
jgi:DME family drug/metabolite transporter